MPEFKISLKAARVNANLTQKEVAKVMQITPQTVVSWESGRVLPKPAELNMMCELYNVPKDYIFLRQT